MRTVTELTTRAWNDVDWRDRYRHIISDDEHAANMLAEVLTGVDQRHPYALCGVSLVCFESNPPAALPAGDCPTCLELNGHETVPREIVPERVRPAPSSAD